MYVSMMQNAGSLVSPGIYAGNRDDTGPLSHEGSSSPPTDQSMFTICQHQTCMEGIFVWFCRLLGGLGMSYK